MKNYNTSTFVKSLVSAVGIIALGACAQGGISFEHTSALGVEDSYVNNGIGYTLVENAYLNDAFIRLQGGIARPITIDERIYGNAITQTIVLEADPRVVGENQIETRLISRGTFNDAAEKLETHGLDATSLRAAFKAAFPGRPFAVDNSLHVNDYGNYAFSFFNAGSNVGCMFGWQNVEAKSTQRTTKLVKNWLRDRTASAHNAQLSFRVRYCAQGFKWSDAINVMKSVQVSVPADVFVRERNLTWGSKATYDPGYSGSNAEDLNYVTDAPYSDVRETICEPGATLDNYRGYGSPCPEKPKPVVRAAPQPLPKPVTTTVTRAPVAAAPTAKPPLQQDVPTVPLPAPSTTPAPIQPGVPLVNSSSITTVPVIQSVQPPKVDAPMVQVPVITSPSIVAVPAMQTAPGSVPMPTPSITAPQIAPVQEQVVPRIIQLAPQAGTQAVPQILGPDGKPMVRYDANGNPIIPLPG